MKIISAGKTDMGRARKNNEDSLLVDDGTALYAVADGIGGHAGGEVASRMAVDLLRDAVNQLSRHAGKGVAARRESGGEPVTSAMVKGIRNANRKIIESGTLNPGLAGMGTTLTAVLIDGTSAVIAHLGDSRAYLFRNDWLDQITEDHSMIAEQVRAGLIRPDQARRSPYRHVITRALGIDREVAPDMRTIEIVPGDTLLLCTDGLTEMLDDREIEQILARSEPFQAVEKLVEAANRRGGVDNITVVAIRTTA